MSSKSIHQFAGFCVATSVYALAQPTPLQAIALLMGTQLGASAPDWLEVPVWTRSGWAFWGGHSVRHSLIPHRTLTHTPPLWLAVVGLVQYFHAQASIPFPGFALLGFFLSVASHLVLDFRTPMGIPLWPLGPRYRWLGRRIRRSNC